MLNAVLPSLIERRRGADWCLFLDRDGVVNTRIMNGYVRTWAEFAFVPGALPAIAVLSRWAPRLVVVTNQQGVGKGLMTETALVDIHARMRAAVAAAGGRVDDVRFCPHLAGDACGCRKPNPGMPLAYLREHPVAHPALSVMVGDTDSDMAMASRLRHETGGCAAIRIDDAPDPKADATFPTLAAFAAAVESAMA